ncbi:MAG: DEAD/DEAH box helicase [Treponema sp.]|nr:DEAD/DEAH box helicase [Treponema sp.]
METAEQTFDETQEHEISFDDLGLDEHMLSVVAKKGFVAPSPIQVLAIPRMLDGDANMIARARTGTGKTAAFGLPIVQRLRNKGGHVGALILEPTRELAIQTAVEMKSFGDGSHLNTCVVYGGASMGQQIKDVRRGAEIVVGTPGRVQDLMDRGVLDISQIEYFILDEGDEMLDMGFIDDIEAIFEKANPESRILLFSATMPKPILKIAEQFMGEYEIVEEQGIVTEPLLIEQKYWVVRESEKIEALVRLIDLSPDFYGLVFTHTKMDADNVTRMLDERGYEVAALHGDIVQAQREKILARFRKKKTRILIATDVAARGIDITGLSHVVNFSLPFDGATYVHRIGRTGRAGAAGIAVTFVRPEELRRKLGYLQAAVRKASKGELVEEKVPSIDDVIGVKRRRIFEQLKEQLGIAASDGAVPVQGDGISLSAGDGVGTADKNTYGAAVNAVPHSHADTGMTVQPAPESAVATENAVGAADANDAANGTDAGGVPATEEASCSAVPAASDATMTPEMRAGECVAGAFGIVATDMKAGDVAPVAAGEAARSGTVGIGVAPADSSGDAMAASINTKGAAASGRPVIKTEKVFRKFAAELCETYDAENVLAAVLSVMYGTQLDRSHYGEIAGTRSGSRSVQGGEQLRVYVQLGRRDGYTPRTIAEFFSDLLHIPGRLVDRIDMAASFTLVSLPVDAAKKAIDISQREAAVPHMHLDVKDGGTRSGRRSERRSRFSDDSFGGHNHFSDWRHSFRERGPREERGSRSHARPNVHTPTERNSASFYRKRSSKAERF